MRRHPLGAVAGLLFIVAACGSTPTTGPAASSGTQPTGGSQASSPVGGTITFWTAEDVQARVDATIDIAEAFTAETGIKVEVVAIAEDQLQQQITSAAAGGTLPDVFGALSLGFTHSLAADDIADPAAAAAVVDALGRDTFSARALEMVTSEGNLVAVPSDAWAQLLVYRQDLFDAASLAEPNTFANILAAAEALNEGKRAGIVAATGPADSFTQQTFEYFALANGCQLTDDAGNITLNTPQCVETFKFYTDLITKGSTTGLQDADTTRAQYFAGNAGMIVWSSFLLDELGALRDDAMPTCAECVADPEFLVKNSGIVTAVSGPSGQPTQFGELVSFAITKGGDNVAEAQQFVEYMMSDGYVDWLALAPEGKFPTRLGNADNPTEYADAWAALEVGVDRKAPLSDLYAQDVIDTLTKSTDTMNRWGFPQGQGATVGPLLSGNAVPAALAEALDGSVTAEEAAANAQADVEEIKAGL